MLYEKVLKSTAASLFFEAKLKEFEAACYFGDAGRTKAAEEDCHSALQGLLDAKIELAAAHIKDAKQGMK